jgi:hypothetical protein
LNQKLIKNIGPKNTFLFFSFLFFTLLLITSICFFFISNNIPSFFGYLFYISLEGYPPFIWSLLWNIFIFDQTKEICTKNSFFASLFAQIGGFTFSYGTYYLIKKNLFLNNCSLFAFILLLSTILMTLNIIIFYFIKKYLNQKSNSFNLILYKNNYDENIIYTWYKSLKKIISSFYIFGIFLMVFCWEIINITLNYFRLDTLTNKSILEDTFLLQNLYHTISLTYFLGIFIVLFGYKFLVKLYGVKNTLMLFPTLLIFLIIPLIFSNNKELLTVFYMIIKAIYPALIFPIKESLFSITSPKIRFQSKAWIDGLGSRLSKACAALYIYFSLFISLENRNIINLIFFSIILSLFFIITYYIGKIWEDKQKNNEIIS